MYVQVLLFLFCLFLFCFVCLFVCFFLFNISILMWLLITDIKCMLIHSILHTQVYIDQQYIQIKCSYVTTTSSIEHRVVSISFHWKLLFFTKLCQHFKESDKILNISLYLFVILDFTFVILDFTNGETLNPSKISFYTVFCFQIAHIELSKRIIYQTWMGKLVNKLSWYSVTLDQLSLALSQFWLLPLPFVCKGSDLQAVEKTACQSQFKSLQVHVVFHRIV